MTSHTASPEHDYRRTSSPQFRRRVGFSPIPTATPTRASTSYPTRPYRTASTTFNPTRSSYTRWASTTPKPTTSTTTATALTPQTDQSIESSHQDSKFTNTRYNQIGEILSDDLIEAITTISRAPLPTRLQQMQLQRQKQQLQLYGVAASSTSRYDAGGEQRNSYGVYEESSENGADDDDAFFTKPFQRVGISTTKRTTIAAKRTNGAKPPQSPSAQSLKLLKPSAFKATIPPGVFKASATPAPPPTTSSTRTPASYLRPFSIPPVSTLYTASLAASVPTVAAVTQHPNGAGSTTRREYMVQSRQKPPPPPALQQLTQRQKPSARKSTTTTSTTTIGRAFDGNLAFVMRAPEEDDADYVEEPTTVRVHSHRYASTGSPTAVPKTNSTKVKVILHDAGLIECLDQGNFPHPLSCRKFISCAKMEIGGVVGWAYTCPKGLSYDPVGGICNWAAGLGCNE